MHPVFIGSDHSGYALKTALVEHLQVLGYAVHDCGAHTVEADDDYPDFIFPVAQAVAKNPHARGIVIGGSGQGEAMAANRLKGVRCALFYGPALPKGAVDVSGRTSNDPHEMIRLTRDHNDANVLSLGARFVEAEEAKKVVQLWLESLFSGAERHTRRIQKLDHAC